MNDHPREEQIAVRTYGIRYCAKSSHRVHTEVVYTSELRRRS